MSLIGVVIGLFVLSLCLLMMSLGAYLYLKKRAYQSSETVDVTEQEKVSEVLSPEVIANGFKDQWLEIVESQMSYCLDMIAQREEEKKDADFTVLLSWKTFLEIERTTIQNDIPCTEIEPYLDVFQALLDKVDKALEIEELQKKVQEQKALLEEVKKSEAKASDSLSQGIDLSSRLKLALDTFQLKLMHEADLDVDLAKVREEIARLCAVRDVVQSKLDLQDSESDVEPIGHLESFLNSMQPPTFLAAMEGELADKVADLKRISTEQLKTIQSLQKESKEMKLGELNLKVQSGNDVLIARLEKVLLDRNRSVKSLENKFNNLHTIRHNLNIDLNKKEEVLHAKDQLLKERYESTNTLVSMKGLLERKHETMQSMEDVLHSVTLTAESDEYSTEQGKRLSELKLMVSESELYVEMLERDLDSAHIKKESYELALAEQNSEGEIVEENNQLRYLEGQKKLKALEEKTLTLQDTLSSNCEAINDIQTMIKSIESMDAKIESVTAEYVALEEKYLMTLIM